MLSIIIISKNEEKYLPSLLKSIKEQNFLDYEIILSDAGSTDKTIPIAKKYGCRIIKGGLPSIGRNNGAKKAKGDLLLFLDSDVLMPKGFLSSCISEFKDRKLGTAGCYLRPRKSSFLSETFTGVYNFFMSVLQYFFPHSMGFCIFSRKDVHKKLNGFDKEIVFAEDYDYINRSQKFGRFRMLKSKRVIYSVRRFEEYGYFRMAYKYFISFFYRVFRGEIKHDLLDYKFASYKKIYKQKNQYDLP